MLAIIKGIRALKLSKTFSEPEKSAAQRNTPILCIHYMQNTALHRHSLFYLLQGDLSDQEGDGQGLRSAVNSIPTAAGFPREERVSNAGSGQPGESASSAQSPQSSCRANSGAGERGRGRPGRGAGRLSPGLGSRAQGGWSRRLPVPRPWSG